MRKRLNGEGTYYHDVKRDRWTYRVTLGYDATEKPIRQTYYGKTPDEAKAKADKARAELGATVSVTPSTTFGEWLTLYIDGYKKHAVKSSWHTFLLATADKLPTTLRNKKVSAITPVELQKLLNEYSTKYAKSHVNKIRTLINSALDEAVENGLIIKNPARKLTVSAKPEKPRQAFTAAEAAAIIAAAPDYANITISTATAVMLYTGLRRGELLGLQWRDLDGDILHIRRGVYLEDNRPVTTEYQAKTARSIRDMPLPPQAAALLDKLPRTSDYIFACGNGNIMHPRNFNRDYQKFIRTLNVRDLSPHCCRHTYATLTLSAGANLRNVQSLLGHSNPSTTARYTHPDMMDLQASVNGMIDMINGKMDANKEANQPVR